MATYSREPRVVPSRCGTGNAVSCYNNNNYCCCCLVFRRYFVLRDGKLMYLRKDSDVSRFLSLSSLLFYLPKEYGIVVEDLRICSVKLADDLERRFCFEVVTPTRSSMLQAESEALRKKWCMYLEAGIGHALRGSYSNKVSGQASSIATESLLFSCCSGKMKCERSAD